MGVVCHAPTEHKPPKITYIWLIWLPAIFFLTWNLPTSRNFCKQKIRLGKTCRFFSFSYDFISSKLPFTSDNLPAKLITHSVKDFVTIGYTFGHQVHLLKLNMSICVWMWNPNILVFAVGRQKSTFRLFGRSSKNDRLFDFSTDFFREITSEEIDFLKLILNVS